MIPNTTKKIGILIPTTSKGRPTWKHIEDTYLFNYFFKSFLFTRSPNHQYIIYIGIDNDDRIFSHEKNRQIIYNLKHKHEGISIKFISMAAAKKGHLTKMWNILFKYAYDDACDYFLQCGDDINFRTKGWINDAIKILETHNGIGITAPICNNPDILTQVFVSRKHMEIFGWLFPEEIINWFCDNWINYVYHPTYWLPLKNHYCSNDGGAERYEIGNDPLISSNSHNKLQKVGGQQLKQKYEVLLKNALYLVTKHQILLKKFVEREQ